MKKIKLLSAITAAVLIVCIVFSGRGVSYLSAETQKDKELDVQYLKEVKMFYAESAEQAKKYCEAEGYIFCPENLKEASSSDLQAYLGYKTTEDEGDAITDMTLLDMKEVAAVFTVPENEIDRIPVGRTATILIPALENMTLEGKVTEKSMTSNPVSHSYKVKVSLPNAKGKFLPGMVCKVYMEQSDQMGYVVPAKAVQTRPEGLAVWTVSHGKACRRLISSTEYVADGVLVKEGLRAGDTIVTEGYQKLYNQASVVFVNKTVSE